MKSTLKYIVLFIMTSLLTSNAFAQRNWFISTTGNDNTGDGTIGNPYASSYVFFNTGKLPDPGDTIFYRGGTYTNSEWGSASLTRSDKNESSTMRFKDLEGTAAAPIVITPYHGEHVVISSDGTAGCFMNYCEYVSLEGFEFKGMTEGISADSAWRMNFTRVDDFGNPFYVIDPTLSLEEISGVTPTPYGAKIGYISTMGVMVSYCAHFSINNNNIHHFPNEGLNTWFSDYQSITGNTVAFCSNVDPGSHGISVYRNNTELGGTNDDVRVHIAENTVHDCYNWSPVYFINSPIENTIDEGRGLTIQRCTDDYEFIHGRILIENNLLYKNGSCGMAVNEGDRVIIRNNTFYHNNETAKYTEGAQQGNIELAANNLNDSEIYNNIFIPDEDHPHVSSSLGVIKRYSDFTNNSVHDNVINGTVSDADVLNAMYDNHFENAGLIDPDNNNFGLIPSSPAVDASVGEVPEYDFLGDLRDENADIGAFEFVLNKDDCFPVNFGSDIVFCASSSTTLNTGLAEITGRTFEWYKNDVLIVDANKASYHTVSSGEYKVVVSGDCNASDVITITSQLLEVQHDTLCESGTANLSVLSSGDFEWYNEEESGGLLSDVDFYNPSISQTDTFYVQDISTVEYELGKTAPENTATINNTIPSQTNIGWKATVVSVEQDLQLNSIDVYPNGSGQAYFDIYSSSLSLIHRVPFTAIAGQVSTVNVDYLLEAGTDYVFHLDSDSDMGFDFQDNNINNDTDYPGVLSFASKVEWAADKYGYFFNWKLNTPLNSCVRTPVLAVVDPQADECLITSQDLFTEDEALGIYPNPTSGIIRLSISTNYRVSNVFGLELQSGTGDTIDISQEADGIYIIETAHGQTKIIKQ